jgi:hypothetical protein
MPGGNISASTISTRRCHMARQRALRRWQLQASQKDAPQSSAMRLHKSEDGDLRDLLRDRAAHQGSAAGLPAWMVL